MTGDRGDIVLGWLTRLVVGLGLVGALAFDGVGLVAARFGADSAANEAAQAAADAWKSSHSLQGAYDAATAAVGSGDTVPAERFSVSRTGRVSLTLDRHARTVLLQHVGPLRERTVVSATVQVGSQP